MTKKEFAIKVSELVGGQVANVEKANGVVMTGVIVGDDTIRPTIYIDSMFDEGMSVEKCAIIVKDMAENANFSIPNLSRILDYNSIKKDLRLRMYYKTTRADVCKSAYRYGFEDIILVPFLENIVSDGAIRISSSLLEKWGVSENTVFEYAKNAGNYEIIPLDQVLREFGDLTDYTPTEHIPMFIVTNKQRCYGAYGSIVLRKKLRQMFASGYFLIPSSVHECIVIPKDFCDFETVNAMVKDVNIHCVPNEEILSNRAYEF